MSNNPYNKIKDLSTVQNTVSPNNTYKKQQQYDEKHRRLFSKPALVCEMCGYPMDYQGHKLTQWEQKWSTHEVCRDKVYNALDRKTGIARERMKRK